MDYKQLQNRISELTGLGNQDIDSLVDALAVIIRESAEELDSVAVPTFGTFTAIKHLEKESIDLSTGQKMLLPPEICLTFTPGGVLKKRINQ